MNTKQLVAQWLRDHGPRCPKTADRVSSQSSWTSRDFVLDTDVSGRSSASCGLAGCPPIYLESAKSLIWSGLVDPRGVRKLRVTTIANHATNLVPILAWLHENNVDRLAEVDEAVLEEWLDDLEDDVADGRFVARDGVETLADARPSLSSIGDRIKAWNFIIDQSASLRDCGQDALPADFRLTVVPHEEAKRLSRRERFGTTPSLPDEIAEEALDAAEQILRELGPGAIRAVEHLYGPDGRMLPDPEARLRSLDLDLLERPLELQDEALDAEDDDGTSLRSSELDHGSFDGRSKPHRSRQYHLMRAVRRIRTAAAVHLLGVSAQRPSELLSIDAVDRRDGDGIEYRAEDAQRADQELLSSPLPSCIVVRTSHSRLYDLFYLKGWVYKRREQRVAGEWLIGSRPAGETDLPSAVSTIVTLERLLAPFRALANDPEIRAGLFVVTDAQNVPTRGPEIRRLSRLRLRTNLLAFYRQEIEWDEMPDFGRSGRDLRSYKVSRGARIRMIQWRKLYVEYMMRADARLRPALYRQLHHVSTATIGGDYLSSDPSIIEGARDASSAELARLLVSIVRGRTVAGRMSEVIGGQLAEVRRLTMGQSGEQAVVTIQHWLRERQLGIYALGPAKCLVALLPQQALCHIVAGTASFRQTAPSYETRTDERCERCPCALVDDEHINFWVNRYVQMRSTLVREFAKVDPADQPMVLREFRVIADRADYARAMLELFEHPVPSDADLL